jgi:hemoglobin-like flavoprotein
LKKNTEKQKLVRQQKTLQNKLLAATTTDEEKATLQQQLDKIAEDLLYVTVPCTDPTCNRHACC